MTLRRRTTLTAGLLLVLGANGILGPFGTDAFLPALPLLVTEFGTTPSTVQLTLTAFTIGMACGQLLLGTLSDRYGRRPLLIGGAALMSLGALLAAAAPSILLLIVCCTVMGLSAAAGVVVSRAVVSDTAQGDTAARGYAALGLVVGIGPIVGPIGGALIMGVANWRGIFVALCLLSVAVLVATILVVPETLPLEERRTGGARALAHTYGLVLRSRRFVAYALVLCFGFGMMFAYISASSFVVQGILGFTAGGYTLVFGANGVGLMLAGSLTAVLVSRVGSRALLEIGVALQAVVAVALGVVVLTGTVSVFTVLPILFVWASSMGFVFGPATSLALADVQFARGSALALMGAVQFLVAGICAPLVGVLGEAALGPLAILGAACATVAGTGVVLGRRAERPRTVSGR
ncbi:multidrug effflux MFS transporter [Okibacterium endophyticum]